MIEEVEELSPNLKVTSIQVWKRKPETFQNTAISNQYRCRQGQPSGYDVAVRMPSGRCNCQARR